MIIARASPWATDLHVPFHEARKRALPGAGPLRLRVAYRLSGPFSSAIEPRAARSAKGPFPWTSDESRHPVASLGGGRLVSRQTPLFVDASSPTVTGASSQRRCPRCGRRAAHADPGCALHGPILAASPEHGATPASEGRRTPVFPGYETRGLLGRGGFGTVFAAVREDDRRPVAIKLAHHSDALAGRRLLQEMAALRSIGPPCVPALHAVGRLDDGSLYLVMEHVDAPTLADRLVGRAEPMPLAEAAALATGMLGALAAVHAHGYVHRDLKPENVLVDDAGQVTLVDFGLVTGGADGADSTAEGTTAGTVEYMSPEQCAGLVSVGASSDLYAFAVILYEVLTGRPPFWGPPAMVRQSH